MTFAGLYVHIPFCKKKCGYCDFTSSRGTESLIKQYLDALLTEIEAGLKKYPELKISTVFFGGGTPTLLKTEDLVLILDNIKGHFHVDKDAEISVEANPGTVDLEKLLALRKAGFNRLSIGTQSFDDNELKILGRIHSEKEIYSAFENARIAGFFNINIDLISAIPGQTLRAWKETLKKATHLGPEHISAYLLEIEENTPFYDRYAKDADEDGQLLFFNETISFLRSKGYAHYEISNFAKPGFECRHNINYWKNGDYLGFGLSAASHIEFNRFENTKELEKYLKDPVNSFEISPLDRTIDDDIKETLFMGLRLTKGIDLGEFERKYAGANDHSKYLRRINELKETGQLRSSENFLFIPSENLPTSNEILRQLI
ncbi:MAG: radical SAM family heme chaperone HemW [Candidatus Saganbacteria bacterium]|nr:radical SAM family heme chaperone HemW [Candidatus Saganbacteria bacterium]